MKRFFLFFIGLLFIGFLFCQNTSTFQIRGKVIDNNNQPIPYANVFLQKVKRGTITNKEGHFQLFCNNKNDILSVSHLGYQTFSTNLEDKSPTMFIQLHRSSVKLKEIVVSNLTAKELLEKAIEKIPQNYSQEEFLAKMFYRAKIIQSNNEVLYVEETALNEIKSYKKSFEDKTFLVKNRNFNFKGNKTAIQGIANYDYVKTLQQDKNRYSKNKFSYSIQQSNYDNMPLYVIEINKEQEDDNITKGKIYINANDLAFVRFELENNVKKHIVQYKKIGEKYFLISGITSNTNKKTNGGFDNVQAEFVVTKFIQPIKKEDIKGVYVKEKARLNDYATQNSDVSFWQKHNQILPDSIISQKIISSQAKQNKNVFEQIEKKDRLKSFQSVYEPNLSLHISSQTPKDIFTFAQNTVSLNAGLNYLLPKKINPTIGLLTATMINYLALNPLEELEVERKILSINNLKGKINPIPINNWDKSYFYDINSQQLNQFKNSNYFDFMKLHNIRNEYHHTKAKLIEEEIVKADMSKKSNLINYLFVYSSSLFLSRFSNVFISPMKEIQDKNTDKTPIIIDVNKSWVKYLFNPKQNFDSHITSRMLTDKEKRYLKRTGYLSWLNLLSPQLFGLRKLNITENWKGTLSLSYLRVPFGEQIEQNLWFSYKNQLNGLFLRQYINHEKVGFGIGYKLYDWKLNNNFNLTSTIDYWLQPKNLSFYDKTFSSGFHIGQDLEWKLLLDKYTQQNKLSLFIGYDFKTHGYQPNNLQIKKQFKINAGIKYNF